MLKIWKRYFDECYKFICNYKNLGERNIISAAVHLDETTPHMHLTFIPVIHTKDEQGNEVDKICARDFCRGRDSYSKLHRIIDKFYEESGATWRAIIHLAFHLMIIVKIIYRIIY